MDTDDPIFFIQLGDVDMANLLELLEEREDLKQREALRFQQEKANEQSRLKGEDLRFNEDEIQGQREADVARKLVVEQEIANLSPSSSKEVLDGYRVVRLPAHIEKAQKLVANAPEALKNMFAAHPEILETVAEKGSLGALPGNLGQLLVSHPELQPVLAQTVAPAVVEESTVVLALSV